MSEEYVTAVGPKLTLWQRFWYWILRSRWAPLWIQHFAWQEILCRGVTSAHVLEVPEPAADVVELDDYRPIWATTRLECPCGHGADGRCFGVTPITADWDHLECPGCRRFTIRATPLDQEP